MAVGKAGEPADRDKLAIWFGGIRVAHKGMRDPAYDEAKVSAAMKEQTISLHGGEAQDIQFDFDTNQLAEASH